MKKIRRIDNITIKFSQKEAICNQYAEDLT